ncbi:hypothetical protein CJ030_MR1G006673 [Morella rubra]|uniref:Uncharacterized protein n=1 Tax=Morella rubra TaxID=262757 RepID=A0A6A1WKX6_9ROSI|nr:hypothetical protein CJ030_MR1G006673 [Morella rubra]
MADIDVVPSVGFCQTVGKCLLSLLLVTLFLMHVVGYELEKRHTLHIYVEHSVNEPIFGEGGEGVGGAGLENNEGGQRVAGCGLENDEGVEGENEEELNRANVMSWFGTGPSITREEEEQQGEVVASGETVQKRKKKNNGDGAETSRDGERRHMVSGGNGGQVNQRDQPMTQPMHGSERVIRQPAIRSTQ